VGRGEEGREVYKWEGVGEEVTYVSRNKLYLLNEDTCAIVWTIFA